MRMLLITLCLSLSGSGCGKEEEPIVVEEVPKASHGMSAPTHGGETSGAKPISYDLPEGWTDREGEGIRKATLVATREGVTGEISVIPLSPVAANVRMNVERWCRQVGAPMPEAKDIMERPVAGTTATMVDLQGEGGRILGAIIPRTDACWFLKMAAREPGDVDLFVKDFEAIIDSVRFGEGAGPDGGR